MKFIQDLRESESVVSYSQVRTKQVKLKKNGEPYIRLVLGDRTGQIEGKIWEDTDNCRELVKEGDFVRYKGSVELYNGGRQLVVERIRKTDSEELGNGLNPSDLIACTQYDIEEMWRALREIVEQNTGRPCVRQLLNNILDRHATKIKSYPAGTEVHHNYWGGFLEHVLSVLESALFFAGKYPGLDRDLMIAGAILHDIGKLEELGNPQNPAYTTRGTLIGHIVMGRDLLLQEASHIADFPPSLLMLLEHVILSHQGQPEWGAPKRPKIPEALIIHYLDDLDAKMNRLYRIIREDVAESDFTQYDRYLGRVIFKGAYDGVTLEA
ncbi:MAG: 3'-5' exoribonuclease YhaM family protein [Acidobacteriota bacterium]